MTLPSYMRGSFPSVIALYRQAVELHQRGAIDEAAQRYEAVLASNPFNFECLHMLGVLRAQMGKHQEAKPLLEKAIAANPRSASAHNNLGLVLNVLGKHRQAIGILKKAVELDPNDPIAHNTLGMAQEGAGQKKRAVASFEKAIALKPDYIEALNNLGAALHKTSRDPEALTPLTAALALNPNFASALANLGSVYAVLDRGKEAKACLQKALSLSARNKSGWIDLGDVHLSFGEIDEARACFEKAFEQGRDDGHLHQRMATVKTFTPDDPQIAEMEALLQARVSRRDSDTISLQFALSKAYDDIGKRDAGFDLLLKANALVRSKRRYQYDEQKTLLALEQIQHDYDATLLHRFAGAGCPSSAPIFIVGMMRSGSTLTEQILASHPQVHALGELPDFLRAANAVRLSDGRSLLSEQAVSLIQPDQLRELGDAYLAAVRVRAGDAKRITDKHLINSNHVGLIHMALPNARIIYTNRDPVDSCLSIFSKFFGGIHPYAYDLGELGRYWRTHRKLMRHWEEVLPEGVMLKIQYEELVADFENHARKIVAHCGLEWDASCLAFQEAKRHVRTASLIQVRQPIYQTSVGKWRPDPQALAPLLEGLGIAGLKSTPASPKLSE